jgi:murein L,D-transpeptidase YafK
MTALFRAKYAHVKATVEASLGSARVRCVVMVRQGRHEAVILAAVTACVARDLGHLARGQARTVRTRARFEARQLLGVARTAVSEVAFIAARVGVGAALGTRTFVVHVALPGVRRLALAVIRRSTDLYLDWIDHRAHAPATGRLLAIPLVAFAVLGMGTSPGAGAEIDEVGAPVGAEMMSAEAGDLDVQTEAIVGGPLDMAAGEALEERAAPPLHTVSAPGGAFAADAAAATADASDLSTLEELTDDAGYAVLPAFPALAAFARFAGSGGAEAFPEVVGLTTVADVATSAESTDAADAAGTADLASAGEAAASLVSAVRRAEVSAGVRAEVSASRRRLSLLERQLTYSRVARAAERNEESVARLLADAGIHHLAGLHLRAFKREEILEVWARPYGEREYRLVHTYSVCAASGSLGPKQVKGDGQVPEGFYHIDGFNPVSTYRLSLHISYPNRADRVRSAGRNPGSAIFVHGGCVSAGCLAITDEGIEQLYWLALLAADEGQKRIPIHIFPTRLDDAGVEWLRSTYSEDFVHWDFWMSLRPAYDAFDRTRRLPRYDIAPGGWYVVTTGESEDTTELDGPVPLGTRVLGIPAHAAPER